jgi:hypothetical protein
VNQNNGQEQELASADLLAAHFTKEIRTALQNNQELTLHDVVDATVIALHIVLEEVLDDEEQKHVREEADLLTTSCVNAVLDAIKDKEAVHTVSLLKGSASALSVVNRIIVENGE